MFRLPIIKFFNRIFNRVTITVVLVALQVLWLLWAFWSFTAGRVWLNGALKVLSILIVLYLVRKDENSAYKVGWIALIGLLPLLGGALYLAFGNKRPSRRLRSRMQAVKRVTALIYSSGRLATSAPPAGCAAGCRLWSRPTRPTACSTRGRPMSWMPAAWG